MLWRPGAFSTRSARLKTPASLPSASVTTRRALRSSTISCSASRTSIGLETGDRRGAHDERRGRRLGRDLLREHSGGEVTIGHDADDPLASVTDGQEAHPGLRHHRGRLQDAVRLGQPLEIPVHDVAAFHGRVLPVASRDCSGRASAGGASLSSGSSRRVRKHCAPRRERPAFVARGFAVGPLRDRTSSHWHAP